ncbi:unnamed protein product [Prunus armeniaca]|uniref:5'-3' exonuclease alpha-helical arch N-terminal domain-containing protein n=1 Tax=Prunus armeniaca TaxID=36596 RepID=A0A6J5TJS9_PRUAR|nr:unnamed protein product [Prunus armeniaca]
MASSHSSLLHIHSLSLRRSFRLFARSFSSIQSPKKLDSLRFSPIKSPKGYCNISSSFNSALPGVVRENGDAAFYSKSERVLRGDMPLGSVKQEEKTVNSNPSDVRVMLIDGTSIIYRAYYKLLGMLYVPSVAISQVIFFTFELEADVLFVVYVETDALLYFL